MNFSPGPAGPSRNRLLAALAVHNLDVLAPHLEAVQLDLRKPLEQPRKPIEHLYFMEHGIASVVTANETDTPIEIGLIGREGVTGLAVILGDDRSPHSTYIQMAGHGQRIGVQPFRTALDKSARLRNILFRYAHTFMIQTAQAAAANARASLEERLARWLLMAHDRGDGDEVPLTHEFLAMMLGTRRPGVTEAIHALAREGLIRAARGVLIVVDRKGLVERAGRFYGKPESEYDRLIGPLRLSGTAEKRNAGIKIK